MARAHMSKKRLAFGESACGNSFAAALIAFGIDIGSNIFVQSTINFPQFI